MASPKRCTATTSGSSKRRMSISITGEHPARDDSKSAGSTFPTRFSRRSTTKTPSACSANSNRSREVGGQNEFQVSWYSHLLIPVGHCGFLDQLQSHPDLGKGQTRGFAPV